MTTPTVTTTTDQQQKKDNSSSGTWVGAIQAVTWKNPVHTCREFSHHVHKTSQGFLDLVGKGSREKELSLPIIRAFSSSYVNDVYS